MTNTKLTDKRTIGARIAALLVADSVPLSDAWGRLIDDAEKMESELQERRKAAKPELNPANLVNKFYERYPLASFRDDGFRAAALGYFMAGAELQCFGEFVKYEELCGDE